MKVQYQIDNSTWVDVYHDNDWQTKFKWQEKVDFGGKQRHQHKNKLVSLFDYVAMTTGHKFDVRKAVRGNMDMSHFEKPNQNFYRHLNASKRYNKSNEYEYFVVKNNNSYLRKIIQNKLIIYFID